MPWEKVLDAGELPPGSKKAVKVGKVEILLVHLEGGELCAVEAKCPHAGAPLEGGAVCNGRLICPWHTGTFSLDGSLPVGTVIEPPPLRSLKSYPVKTENGAILVDPQPQNAPSLANYDDNAPLPELGADRHIVAIGGGAAAAAAFCALRQGGFAGRITVVDSCASEPVDRTVLSKMALAGTMPVHELPLWPLEEAQKLACDRLTARVVSLDSAAGTLCTATGETLRFDAALLAPGGIPTTLAIPGEDGPHVHTLRHADDLEAINAVLGQNPGGPNPGEKRAVLIGDSFIAFEGASALIDRGLKVTLVCRSPQPFSEKFGEAPAQAIVNLHRAKGVTLKLGAEAGEITPEGVTLKSGEHLPADLVIVAIGVRPATDFKHGLSLEQDGGVPVEASLQAAAKLWVAGDIASVGGTRIEHWRLAQQHGSRAARGMLQAIGGASSAGLKPDPPFDAPTLVPFFWTFHFGKRFGYLGHATTWDEVQVDGSLGEASFLAYYVKGEKVEAVFGCGRDAAIAILAESMRRPLTLKQARQAAASAG